MNYKHLSFQFIEDRQIEAALPALVEHRVPMVMLVNVSAEGYRKVANAMPWAKIVIRWVGDPGIELDDNDGYEHARWLWQDKFGSYGLDKSRVILHGKNEGAAHDLDNLYSMGRHDHGFIRWCRKNGVMCGWHSFPTGTPEAAKNGDFSQGVDMTEWNAYLEGLDGAVPTYIFVHEYFRFETHQYNLWNEVGRFHRYVRPNLPAEYREVPVIVTEAGFESGGWRAAGFDPAEYFRWYKLACDEVYPDDTHVMLFAWAPGHHDWNNYSIHDIYGHLTDLWEMAPDEGEEEEEEEPVPEPGMSKSDIIRAVTDAGAQPHEWMGTPVVLAADLGINYVPETPRVEPRLHGWRGVWDSLPHAAEPPIRPGELDGIEALVWHHFASAPANKFDEASIERHIRAAARWHVERFGWPSIGYCYVIDARGVIWWTAPARWRTIHAGNAHYNDVGVAIAFPDDHRYTPLTQEQKESALWLAERLRTIVGKNLPEKLHWEVRDAPTACPGRYVAEFRDEIR